MFGKILLIIRIIIPFIFNILLFLWIYESNKGKEFALTDSLFNVGIISFIYGLGTIYLFSRSSYSFNMNPRNHAINSALADQHIKNYHKGKRIGSAMNNITTTHIKFIYIVLGILLCILSAIIYFI